MLKKIIKTILFDGLTDASSILAIFPDSFTQTNLKNLVAKLLAEQLPRFKKSIIDNQSNNYLHKRNLTSQIKFIF